MKQIFILAVDVAVWLFVFSLAISVVAFGTALYFTLEFAAFLCSYLYLPVKENWLAKKGYPIG
tara:strand:- start:4985 stop:5173 length:189 start_codon:yes stop_codon:yes gene_type:complete